jgi:hypothetical protein
MNYFKVGHWVMWRKNDPKTSLAPRYNHGRVISIKTLHDETTIVTVEWDINGKHLEFDARKLKHSWRFV